MKKIFFSISLALIALNLSAANGSQTNDSDWDWVLKEKLYLNETSGKIKQRFYYFYKHPEYKIYPHGLHLCEDCGDTPIDQQYIMLSIYDHDTYLVRIISVNKEWFNDGKHKPIDDLRMVPLQMEYAKAGVGDKMSANTKYAIENSIGLRSDQDRLQELALKYKLYSYMKNNPGAMASLSAQEKKDFNADLAKLEKMDISKLKDEHNEKMDDDAAFVWEKQMKAELNVSDYQIVNITRISDLAFKVEMADSKGRKFDAKISFSQKEKGKFGVKYKVEAM